MNEYEIVTCIRNFYTVEDIDAEFDNASEPIYFNFKLAELKDWLFSIERIIPKDSNNNSHFMIYTQYTPLINKFKSSRSYYKVYIPEIVHTEITPLSERCLNTSNVYRFVNDNCDYDIYNFIFMVKNIIKNPYIAAYNSYSELRDYSYISEFEAREFILERLEEKIKRDKRCHKLYKQIFLRLKILKTLGFIKKYYLDKSVPLDDANTYSSIYYNSTLHILSDKTEVAENLVNKFVNKFSYSGLIIPYIDTTSDELQYMYNIGGMKLADKIEFERLVEIENQRLNEVKEFEEEI